MRQESTEKDSKQTLYEYEEDNIYIEENEVTKDEVFVVVFICVTLAVSLILTLLPLV